MNKQEDPIVSGLYPDPNIPDIFYKAADDAFNIKLKLELMQSTLKLEQFLILIDSDVWPEGIPNKLQRGKIWGLPFYVLRSRKPGGAVHVQAVISETEIGAK